MMLSFKNYYVKDITKVEFTKNMIYLSDFNKSYFVLDAFKIKKEIDSLINQDTKFINVDLMIFNQFNDLFSKIGDNHDGFDKYCFIHKSTISDVDRANVADAYKDFIISNKLPQ